MREKKKEERKSCYRPNMYSYQKGIWIYFTSLSKTVGQ